MSGPVTPDDAPPLPSSEKPAGAAPVEVLDARRTTVGDLTVRRALPRRAHRTVGAWCFADHMGPAAVTEDHGIDIGPHPHCGLQTVTWLVEGEVLHRDSLGTEQVVRAGQLNLMTAGHGVSHSEEATGSYRGPLHGIQLWVAQPEATRHGQPEFEHHAELPQVELGTHGAVATVLVGTFAGAESPARRDTDHVAVDLDLPGRRTLLPVAAAHEHALIVLDGAIEVEGTPLGTGQLAHLETGWDEIVVDALDAPARVVLLGGRPFEEELVMWWNFVARSTSEVDAARSSWELGDGRFGRVDSPLDPIGAPQPGWARP